jgi:hypothetical protein
VAGEIDPLRVVNDAIENGVSVGRIADQPVPFVEPAHVPFNRSPASLIMRKALELDAIWTIRNQAKPGQRVLSCRVAYYSIAG